MRLLDMLVVSQTIAQLSHSHHAASRTDSLSSRIHADHGRRQKLIAVGSREQPGIEGTSESQSRLNICEELIVR
jgi:hypothetical protein